MKVETHGVSMGAHEGTCGGCAAALMVAVGETLGKSIVACRGDAVRAHLDRHGDRSIMGWLCPPRAPGLWVTEADVVGGAIAWQETWRRATSEEVARFVAGERVWP